MAVTHWWTLQGYYSFAPGEGNDAGFPCPGQVIKHYRSLKHWTQRDLAKALGVSESWVRAMENMNESLDSISRRRMIAAALAIPPVLLGLVSAESVTARISAITTAKELQLQTTSLAWYQDSLQDTWALYYTGNPQTLLPNVSQKLRYLSTFAAIAGDNQQQQALKLQGRFDLIAARIAADQSENEKALKYLKAAVKMATALQDNELLGMAYFWQGRTYLEQDNNKEAVTSLEKALSYTKYVPTQLKGAIFLEAGLAYAYTTQTAEEKKRVLTLFDQAGTVLRQSNLEEDGSFVKLTTGRYHQFKAEAFLAMQQPTSASRELDLAEQHTGAELTRRRAYINILRAKAAIVQGDYPSATFIALDALGTCKAIKSSVNIAFIGELYNELSKSSYANSPDVTKLMLELKV